MKVMAMILAGGQGSRLSILSSRRAKPAVPFGGVYRIIDFTLSNVMHAQIPIVGVLTQYRPSSLMDHIGAGEWWGFTGRGRLARILPPYQGINEGDWYVGTADAVYQNRDFIERFSPDLVLILSGDHIYKMDFVELLRSHLQNHADLTIAMQTVPWEETPRFGLVEMDWDGKIVRFQEKPKKDPISNTASLGIYVFSADVLLRRLHEDAERSDSSHDFGKDIIPGMLGRDRLYGWVFDGYWRDVGTIQSFWETNMETLRPQDSGCDLEAWRVYTKHTSPTPAGEVPAWLGGTSEVRNSYVSRGCLIEGSVENSILFPGVQIARGTHIANSIVMNDCRIGPMSTVRDAILDKAVTLGASCRVGEGDDTPHHDASLGMTAGISVLGKHALLPDGTTVGRNAIVQPDVRPEHLTSSDIPSGSTVECTARP